jgi:hypothetical protein
MFTMSHKLSFLIITTLLTSLIGNIAALSSVSSLLTTHSDRIASMKQLANKYPNAPQDDVFYLRYCLSENKDDDTIMSELKSALDWRSNQGKSICDSAREAVQQATAKDGAWNNEPVRALAPHANIVNKYITPNQCLTTTLHSGDLVYCISAGRIDDVKLMREISVEDIVDFFLYTKEVNAIVSNMRSLQSDRLIKVLTANDLSGVKLIGGDATFRKAIGLASTKANQLYPNLNGPTFLLNLPKLVSALVKLFTPLFPEEVNRRLKFAQGPLKNVDDLMTIGPSGDVQKRKQFLSEIDALLH